MVCTYGPCYGAYMPHYMPHIYFGPVPFWPHFMGHTMGHVKRNNRHHMPHFWAHSMPHLMGRFGTIRPPMSCPPFISPCHGPMPWPPMLSLMWFMPHVKAQCVPKWSYVHVWQFMRCECAGNFCEVNFTSACIGPCKHSFLSLPTRLEFP